jgi:hypothetical protein
MSAPYAGDVPLRNGQQESLAARREACSASDRKKGRQHTWAFRTVSLRKESPMEATILTIFVAVLYSIVGLALIVLPLRFRDSPGEDPALGDVRA